MKPEELANIALFANILLVVLTGIYVFLTRQYVILTRQTVAQMKASRDPSVYIDLEFPDNTVRGVIGNLGQSAAINIKFKVVDNIPWVRMSRGLLSLEPINDGISYLPPGRTLKYSLSSVNWAQLNKENAILKIQVSYENETREQFKREYVIDISQYNGVLFETYKDTSMEVVANAIRETGNSRHPDTNQHGTYRVIPSGQKICPMCAELIPIAAKKCSHCNELLEEKIASSSTKKGTRKKKG